MSLLPDASLNNSVIARLDQVDLRLAGAIRGCNIGHKDSLESPQTDVLYFLVNPVLYGKSL
jgi:hypothetical protein